MKDINPNKPDPKHLEDHPYNRDEETPSVRDRWFKYVVRILLLSVLLFFAYRIIQAENVFDVIGGFFQNGMQSW